MSATTWLIIAIVGFSLSGIALVAAVFIFIKLNILAVIGDLSGKTIAREIKAMRESNSKSGEKIHKSSQVNRDRGMLTEKVDEPALSREQLAAVHSSKRLDRTSGDYSVDLLGKGTSVISEKLSDEHETTESLSMNVDEVDIEARRATAVLAQNRVTDVLNPDNSTEILTQAGTTDILSETREVDRDSGEDGFDSKIVPPLETTVLSEVDEKEQEESKKVHFVVIKSIVETHTDEVIE